MSDLISREEALSHPFANGKYDKENANLDYILGFESYKEWLETLPIVDIIDHARAIKEYCEHFPECEGCRFYKGLPFRCVFVSCPQGWDLPEGEAKPNESLIKDCCEAQGHLWADNNIFEDVEENQ